MNTRTVSATEFKAKCLAILDEVEQGAVVTVTRRGKPVAELKSPKPVKWKSPADSWKGKGLLVRDDESVDRTHLYTAYRSDPTNS